MIEIIIGNSYSKIKHLNPAQERALRKALSYTVGGSSAYFTGFGIRKKSLLSKKGDFPTGLLKRVMDTLKDPVSVVDRRIRPDTNPVFQLPSSCPSPHSWQVSALADAYLAHRGTISACTGSGKSLLIALIASRLNVDTLVVVPTLEIKKQLSETLIRVLGRKHKCTVENIDSTALKSGKKYDCLIIDEAHHTAAKTYQDLNKTVWSGIYYRFFMTATPFRNDSEETLLFEAIAGKVIYKLDYETAIKDGYIVPIKAYYIDLPKQPTDAFTWQEVYKDLVVNNEYRNNMISSMLRALSSKSVLCMVKEVAHGKNIDCDYFVHGQDEESRELIQRFNDKEILGLVGTTGIIGEGVDTRPCEYVIIAGLGKAKSQFMQQVGRAVRKYPDKEYAKIIIFRDPSHKYLLRHFKEQCKILKEEYGGVTAIKLEI
jgi:superfamily II DNA or RNA helicase